MPRRSGLFVLLACVAMLARPAAAQQRVVVQGLADVEGWSTHGDSPLLIRNNDHLATLGRLQMWGAGQLARNLTLISLVAVEGGAATDEGQTEFYLEQLVLRYAPKRWMVFDAGRFPSVFGGFAPRRLSNSNPLIGTPNTYPETYPWGVQLSGVSGMFDWRAAVVDRADHDAYVPESGKSMRFVAGGGVSPMAGLRLGVSATRGPYLGRNVAEWGQFEKRALGFDGAFSHGYFEMHAELMLERYEVPDSVAPVHGAAWYVEGKYTFTPRLFTAVRLEQNQAAYIEQNAGEWEGVETRVVDGEVGMGYRLDASTLIKVSYRQDHWSAWDEPDEFPRGHAIALQVSRGIDITGWLSRPR